MESENSSKKMFLSDQRNLVKTAMVKSFQNFNGTSHCDFYDQTLGSLILLNDELLVAAGQLEIDISEAVHLIVLPLAGDLNCLDVNGDHTMVNAGTAKVCSLLAGSSCVLSNPYESDVINFLQIRIKDQSILKNDFLPSVNFDLKAHKDQLIEFFSTLRAGHSSSFFTLNIGRFTGKTEINYKLKKHNAIFFAFVISGVFEVGGSLLNSRDGLGLWDLEAVEIVALCDDATLLILEFI